MKPATLMLIAGEASGDGLAAELVPHLREELLRREGPPTTDYQPLHAGLEPRFIGAGGPRMAAAGVELAFDLTAHSVIGLSDVLRNYLKFRRLFRQLLRLACDRLPEAIICVDFSGFNRRFAHAIKKYVRARQGWFHPWHPLVVQYVSPQVWASREARVYQMARDYDLVLSLFAFEKDWYARRVPQLPVEFVGHPMLDRYAGVGGADRPVGAPRDARAPLVLLLPGSRPAELARHLPVMLGAMNLVRLTLPNVRARMVLPNDSLARQARDASPPEWIEVQTGGLPESLAQADLAIASTGTVTLECACFGVPTVALYKTSWSTYQIAKHLVTVKFLAMPNLLAGTEVFPEFVQDAATAENISHAALNLLRNEERRAQVKAQLKTVVAALGTPGASERAARVITSYFSPAPS